MNIAIVGYGKMGQEIEKVAKGEEINVISTIELKHTARSRRGFVFSLGQSLIF